MADYGQKIEELIEKKLRERLEALAKEREAAQAESAAAREGIERERETEIRGAFSDYAQAVDPYGVGAEKTADRGLWGSGVNQTAQVGYYNAYQNALAAIREKAQASQDKLAAADREREAGFGEDESKIRSDAYTALLEELQTRREREDKAAEQERAYAFKEAEAARDQANRDRSYALSASKASSKTQETASSEAAAGDGGDYPEGGTESEKFNWYYRRLLTLRNRLNDGDAIPGILLHEARTLLGRAQKELTGGSFEKLRDLYR